MMAPRLAEALVSDFPLLYSYLGPRIECHDGWEPVIRWLSVGLEAEINRLRGEDGADYDLLPCAVQVKEKYGGLRFYVGGGTRHMHALIEIAEEECWRRCEMCGIPGVLRRGGWVRTLCDACHQDPEIA